MLPFCACGCRKLVSHPDRIFILGHFRHWFRLVYPEESLRINARSGHLGGSASTKSGLATKKLLQWKKLNPYEARKLGQLNGPRNLQSWRERDPIGFIKTQSRLGKKGGSMNTPKQQRARSKVNKLRIKRGLAVLDANPELRSKGARKMNETLNKNPYRAFQIRSNAGKLGGKRTQQLHPEVVDFLFDSQHGTYIKHDDHFHRSPDELEYCYELRKLYDSGLLRANVRFKGIEIDWILAKDTKTFSKFDPSTWLQVVEHHKVRSWEGETVQSYRAKRISQLRERGVECPIEVVCF